MEVGRWASSSVGRRGDLIGKEWRVVVFPFGGAVRRGKKGDERGKLKSKGEFGVRQRC